MKKAFVKTSIKMLAFGLALTAMLFGCKQNTDSAKKPDTTGGTQKKRNNTEKYVIRRL